MTGLSAPTRFHHQGHAVRTVRHLPANPGLQRVRSAAEAFYADPVAYGKKPVGNGPFRADTDGCPAAE